MNISKPNPASPDVLRVICAQGQGAGVVGSAHMQGDWSRTYLMASGDTIQQVLVALGLACKDAGLSANARHHLEVARSRLEAFNSETDSA